MRKIFPVFIFLILIFSISKGQEKERISDSFLDTFIQEWLSNQQDSTYIESYTRELSLRLLGVSKYNYFQLKDRNTGAILGYNPESKNSLGLGITYRWFSLDFTFRVGVPRSSIESSRAFDFQGRIFGLKQYVELTARYYFGYEINRTEDLSNQIPDSLKLREDIRTAFFSMDYMYAFNYEKFSFKAPFFYNELQKKSAGSLVTGASFYTYMQDGDDSIIPEVSKPDFNPELYFQSLYLANLSLHFGYIHTFVIRRYFYVTLGLIPGISLSTGDYQLEERKLLGIRPSLKAKTMNSIGYNSRRFYTGVQIEGDLFKAVIDKKADVEVANSKVRLFIGYRFKRS